MKVVEINEATLLIRKALKYTAAYKTSQVPKKQIYKLLECSYVMPFLSTNILHIKNIMFHTISHLFFVCIKYHFNSIILNPYSSLLPPICHYSLMIFDRSTHFPYMTVQKFLFTTRFF